jgi:uncharacterized protein
MVKNITGSPVRGESFFNRDKEIARIWDFLHTDHLLLLAPRRVGKTSALFRVQADAQQHGAHAVYVSAAKGIQDELAFVQKLYEVIAENPAAAPLLDELKKGRFGRLFSRIQSFSLMDLEVAFRDDEVRDWQKLGSALVEGLQALKGNWVLMVDELPIFVLKLIQQDETGRRARAFLEWFRDARQGPSGEELDRVHWLLAGSIGLDALSRRFRFGDTINDLRVIEIGPFSEETAHRFLETLGASYEITLDETIRKRICERVEWLIPYYLNLVFSEIRERCSDRDCTVSIELVDEVFEALLSPARRNYFDYWNQRLSEEFGQPRDSWARALLAVCAADPAGATRATLKQTLLRHVEEKKTRDEELNLLLDLLVGDGYIVDHKGRYRFRSSLLREYWRRRVLKDEESDDE